MSDRDELIRKLQEEIERCTTGKLDDRLEYDMQRISLSAFNTRLAEWDKRLAEARTQLAELKAEPASPAQPAEPTPAEPQNGSGDERWDVFISYARESEAAAREVNQRLTAAGLRVWQDVHNIRHTDQWLMAIDQALRKSDRLVLLMTPEAMESRGVFIEWFFYYEQSKPIHCLLLETCDRNAALLPYQYLDWREPDKRDWDQLLRELRAPFKRPETITPSPIVGMPGSESTEAPSPFADLLQAARDPNGSIALTQEQIKALVAHKATDLAEYRLARVAEWSQPRYALDNRFVHLTLLLDKGESEPQRWQPDDYRFNDLREVLDRVDDPALVLLGAPGSGKSTLLRRLQMDHSLDQIRQDGPVITFFVQLNGYRGEQPPHEWLSARWAESYPGLAPLDAFLQAGQTLLLLDALNEMPHNSIAEYHERVGLWRAFMQDVVRQGNRAVFSCRSLDYSASLSSKDLRVPQLEVQPMSPEKVHQFIEVYSPTRAEQIWNELEGSPQFDLFRTPIYLKLLLDQVKRHQHVPRGKAELFTQFVRQQIMRNIQAPLFAPDGLLTEHDHTRLAQDQWREKRFDLPDDGILIPALTGLAYAMQQRGLETEGAQVRVPYAEACKLIAHERDQDTLKAGVALNVLDEDVGRREIIFFHQLLQEFFAARALAADPQPEIVHTAWQAAPTGVKRLWNTLTGRDHDYVTPSLEETLARLADGDPLPPLPQTGWEETTLTAAPMARDPNAFIRALLSHNLPLAARCAASPEVIINPDLKREIQQALIARTQDMSADLRARIAAGLALGELGDPRFERREGPYGAYLLPPLVEIEGGTYPMGLDDSPYANEKRAHTVELTAFQIGQFPVTNAEYALFMEAGGYEDEQWWDTDAARAWLRGEGSTEGQKASWREQRNRVQNWSEDYIRGLMTQNRITSQQAREWIAVRNWTDERFEQFLDERHPEGEIYRKPEYWDDGRLNNPAQPVVGVTWFEARAYCAWLSAQYGQRFTLPSEAQFEAAARGKTGRLYPYGRTFEVTRSNTFESHIRRTTPVGIFDNATPEGVFDLSGNAYTWTTSIYDQERFPYPYRADDGREEAGAAAARRVLRGGSWVYAPDGARAAYRSNFSPHYRFVDVGFRVLRPPSL